MSVYSPKINTSLVMDNVFMPSPSPTRTSNMFPLSPVSHPSDSDSDSDNDSCPLRFYVANPGTNDNRNSQLANDTPLTAEQAHATVTPPPPSTQGQQDEERRVVKDLPPLVLTTTPLVRRQSKTQQDDTTMQHPPFYSISDTVEYQPHHLRASVLEPVSNTANHNHSPLLLIPPAPSQPPPPPSKDALVTTPTTKTTPPANPISYSLVHHPGAIKLYRDMAEKTQDDGIQLNYAKYLMEAAGTDLLSHKQKSALQNEGLLWIRRLSKKGVGEAALMEAMWMEMDLFGYKSYHGARIDRLYHIAIQAGVPLASYQLALRKESSQTTHPYDIFRLYQKAADLNCVEALYKMAKIYLFGELDQVQDYKNGMNYLVTAAQAATETCHEPPYALALILTNKHTKVTLPSNLAHAYGGMTQAVDYMDKSARLGNVGAKNRLGHILEHGAPGVAMDIARAFTLYEQAAEHHHLQSMLALSRLYNRGCHGPDDDKEEWRLAQDTSRWFHTHPKDPVQSFEWCQRAAKGGLPDALYLLGWYYETGWGVPRHDTFAAEYYRQAARKGQAAAQARCPTPLY